MAMAGLVTKSNYGHQQKIVSEPLTKVNILIFLLPKTTTVFHGICWGWFCCYNIRTKLWHFTKILGRKAGFYFINMVSVTHCVYIITLKLPLTVNWIRKLLLCHLLNIALLTFLLSTAHHHFQYSHTIADIHSIRLQVSSIGVIFFLLTIPISMHKICSMVCSPFSSISRQ